jgi:polyribonucleotide nucleotidyltransferase
MMVESQARELSEDVMLGAVLFAHDEMQEGRQCDHRPRRKGCQGALGRCRRRRQHRDQGQAQEADRQGYRRRLQADRQVGPLERAQRGARQGQGSLREDEDAQIQMVAIKSVKKVEADVVRGAILKDGKRIDGRTTTQVRPIEAMVGFLPRTHGSALFTRGETQAICTTTLGTKDASR